MAFWNNEKADSATPGKTQGVTDARNEATVNSLSVVATRNVVYLFGGLMFCIGAGAVLILSYPKIDAFRIILALIVGIVLMACIRIAPQWEKDVVLRFGTFNRLCGPGIFLAIPFIEHVSAHIDQRVQTTTFFAEEALTEDLVPVDVDAVLFWVVWDPRKACLEVQDYVEAVIRSSQTALRDTIGTIELSDLSSRRRQLDNDLQQLLDAKCAEWGISVQSVEIKNIFVPKELQVSLARKAQAKQEREARMALAETERDISEIYVEAANVYGDNATAVQLRAMNLVNEGVKEKGGMIVVPSAYSEGFEGAEKPLAK